MSFCVQASLKSDMSKTIQFKSWCVVKILTQSLTRCIYFLSKADAMSFSSVQNLICSEIVISKADQTKKVIFKIWCVVKFQFQNLMRFFHWIQNLTRCIFFYPKSDMSEYYNSECYALIFTSISNTFYSIFLKSDAISFSSVQKLTCGKLLNQNHSFQKSMTVAECVVFTDKMN